MLIVTLMSIPSNNLLNSTATLRTQRAEKSSKKTYASWLRLAFRMNSGKVLLRLSMIFMKAAPTLVSFLETIKKSSLTSLASFALLRLKEFQRLSQVRTFTLRFTTFLLSTKTQILAKQASASKRNNPSKRSRASAKGLRPSIALTQKSSTCSSAASQR